MKHPRATKNSVDEASLNARDKPVPTIIGNRMPSKMSVGFTSGTVTRCNRIVYILAVSRGMEFF
jgi:hypothetical protein